MKEILLAVMAGSVIAPAVALDRLSERTQDYVLAASMAVDAIVFAVAMVTAY